MKGKAGSGRTLLRDERGKNRDMGWELRMLFMSKKAVGSCSQSTRKQCHSQSPFTHMVCLFAYQISCTHHYLLPSMVHEQDRQSSQTTQSNPSRPSLTRLDINCFWKAFNFSFFVSSIGKKADPWNRQTSAVVETQTSDPPSQTITSLGYATRGWALVSHAHQRREQQHPQRDLMPCASLPRLAQKQSPT